MPSSLDRPPPGADLPDGTDASLKRLLASVPDSETAFRLLLRLRAESPASFDRVANSPAGLRAMAYLFSHSSFLSEGALRSPAQVLQVVNSGAFYRVRSVEEFEERLCEFLGGDEVLRVSAADLARFRRLEIQRIVLRDVLGIAALPDVVRELSNLADAILDVAWRRVRAELVEAHGKPLLAEGGLCAFSVISLGKLGGEELNYSSDIDLMFVYGGNGETDGAVPISNKEFYKKVANQYTALLSSYTPDGQCYRVDLRLRPDGALGEVCISTEAAKTYYTERARDWEKQMLIKARVSAGEREPGEALLAFVEPLIYRTSIDFRALEAVSETRQRISEKIAARRGTARTDVKLMPGGIRDIEFLVQCLQRLHGGREPWVRHGGTMMGLSRLRDKNLLSDDEYARLFSAYQFLRHLEHRLQIVEDRQTHALPGDPAQLAILARRMPAEPGSTPWTAETLRTKVREHVGAVREIYERVIHAQRPLYETPPAETLPPAEPEPPPTSVVQTIEHQAPQLAGAVAAAGLQRGKERLQHFLEKAVDSPAILERLESDSHLATGVLDIFEHSPYFADELLRHPELIEEIGEPFQLEGGPLRDNLILRRYYRRQMLRIQAQSILAAEPIFQTLSKTSILADSVIASAYELAVRESRPLNPDYAPKDQMMVIALGRLGMREFDLGSDADLVFVVPDQDAAELAFWTTVAERMIEAISSYTGEGVMFAIDTRLKPNGREGDLVQPVSAYHTYFEKHAEAWEGISYMKARSVAGNLEASTEFLQNVQALDWRRYGQSMRSRKELAAMRVRLEREQGSRNPLKAGPGGYYDIDFALMYLRLKGAGIFYKVLNTPERIDVIEKMGHLDREEADFLCEAATFYRAIDHGQRISIGHAAGSLPSAPAQLEVLAALVDRWAPPALQRQPLEAALQNVQRRTREFFNRLFGNP